VSKKVSGWQKLYFAMAELADRRGDALSRVWVVIETQVQDAGLANELRMAIVGNMVPDVAVWEDYESEEEADSE